jgi:hypothetical protein
MILNPYAHDPFAPHVVSLLHFNGANASTTFTDETGKTWSAVGNAQLSTAQQKYGSASLLLDGTGDYITSPSGSANGWIFDQDFTVEMYVKMPLPPSTSWQLFTCDQAFAVSEGHYLTVNSAGTMFWSSSRASNPTVSSNIASSAGAFSASANTWAHIAVTRSGTTNKIYLNGVEVATGTLADVAAPESGRLAIIGAYDSSYGFVNGNIDFFRFTRAVRYTGTFTPP